MRQRCVRAEAVAKAEHERDAGFVEVKQAFERDLNADQMGAGKAS